MSARRETSFHKRSVVWIVCQTVNHEDPECAAEPDRALRQLDVEETETVLGFDWNRSETREPIRARGKPTRASGLPLGSRFSVVGEKRFERRDRRPTRPSPAGESRSKVPASFLASWAGSP